MTPTALLPQTERDLPLPKSSEATILAPQQAGISGMSAKSKQTGGNHASDSRQPASAAVSQHLCRRGHCVARIGNRRIRLQRRSGCRNGSPDDSQSDRARHCGYRRKPRASITSTAPMFRRAGIRFRTFWPKVSSALTDRRGRISPRHSSSRCRAKPAISSLSPERTRPVTRPCRHQR